MPAAVIFDIGGVLELTPPTGWEDRWADRLGLRRSELVARLGDVFAPGATGEATLPEIERRVAGLLALNDAQVAALMEDVWTEYLGTLNSELAHFFAGLRPRWRTAILSNSFVGARERERSAYGFEDMCDLVVYSHEEGVVKPDARIYDLVCRRLGVSAQECVFLDDKQECVDGALRAGMRAVRFTGNRQAMAEIQRLLER